MISDAKAHFKQVELGLQSSSCNVDSWLKVQLCQSTTCTCSICWIEGEVSHILRYRCSSYGGASAISNANGY